MINSRIDSRIMKLLYALVVCLAMCACKGKKNSDFQNVYNLIIIDESGSMKRIEEEAVKGLNETFQTIADAQKEHTQQRHYVSLVTFNGKRIKTVYDRKPVEKLNEKWKDYHPDDMTPLFETMMIRNLNLAKCSLGNDATYILGDSMKDRRVKRVSFILAVLLLLSLILKILPDLLF